MTKKIIILLCSHTRTSICVSTYLLDFQGEMNQKTQNEKYWVQFKKHKFLSCPLKIHRKKIIYDFWIEGNLIVCYYIFMQKETVLDGIEFNKLHNIFFKKSQIILLSVQSLFKIAYTALRQP